MSNGVSTEEADGFDLRRRRIDLGLRQRDVAARAGVTETLLRMWERGLDIPDEKAARKLAGILGVKVDVLLRAQVAHSEVATPGEGYTTSEAGRGQVFLRRAEPSADSRRVLDLFCGSGGLSFGFEQTGEFVTSCGIDLLADRVRTFVSNHRHANGVAGDIRLYPLRELAKLTGRVDVLVGGPPCQGFSSIRPFRTLTEGDPRNSLAEHYVLVLHRLQPAWFVFENVVGILTHERGARLDSVLEGLTGAGYQVDWRVLNAALYGVPQHRERVVIVGSRDGVPFHWPAPTHRVDYKGMAGNRAQVIRTDALFSARLPSAVTLMEAIGDLPAVSAGKSKTTMRARLRTTTSGRCARGATDG